MKVSKNRIRIHETNGRFYIEVHAIEIKRKFDWKRFRFISFEVPIWRDLSITGAIHYPNKYPFPYPKHQGFDTMKEAIDYAQGMATERIHKLISLNDKTFYSVDV